MARTTVLLTLISGNTAVEMTVECYSLVQLEKDLKTTHSTSKVDEIDLDFPYFLVGD